MGITHCFTRSLKELPVKKISIISLLCALMMLPGLAQQAVDAELKVYGKRLQSDLPPVKMGGTVMVPLRPIFKALGASVKYENGEISAERGSKKVLMRPGSRRAKVNGKELTLQTPPTVVRGSTYVPLRFVAKALGDSVNYDAQNKLISVGQGEAPAESGIDTVAISPDRIDILKGKLKQLVVGNQGAILKVRNPDASAEVYYRGLDDRATAPYKAADHTGILNAIGMTTDSKAWAQDAVYAFNKLPKRNAVALLGLLYSIGPESSLDAGPEVDGLIKKFLIEVIDGTTKADVYSRRQAVLSLAVADKLDNDALESVLKLYETTENLWLTFPVQQFFEYHAAELRARPDLATIRGRVGAVNSLYTANILEYLDGKS